jgi:hypothetical protein
MEATYIISGEEYLLVDLFVTSENREAIKYACEKVKTVDKEIKQYDKGSLFRNGYAICSIYVPINKIDEFNKLIKDGIYNSKKETFQFIAILGVVFFTGAVVAYYFLKKKFGDEKKYKKLNIFQRFKLWFKSKFKQKTISKNKIIRITNEPSFNKGVISYVGYINSDLVAQPFYCSPNLEVAHQFNVDSKELKEAFEFAVNAFPNAKVEIVDYKN